MKNKEFWIYKDIVLVCINVGILILALTILKFDLTVAWFAILSALLVIQNLTSMYGRRKYTKESEEKIE